MNRCNDPVHEIGEHDARHCFTMDFVDGRSLAHAVREKTYRLVRVAKTIVAAISWCLVRLIVLEQ